MTGKTSNLIEYQDEGAIFYPVARALVGLVFQGPEEGIGSPENPLAFPVIPKSAKVVINSYRQADSWELTFDARDLPFDPQKLRMGTVEISMFLTNGIEEEKRLLSRQFAESEDAGAGKARGYVEVQRARKEVAAMEASDRRERSADARRTYFEDNEPLITGLFDEAGISCSGAGRWVTLSGQDYTAMLIGRQWHPLAGGRARRIPADGQRADDFAEALLREVDPNGILSVKVMGMEDDELPKIGDKKGIGLKGKRGIPIEKETSYWDVIYKTLTRHGLLCYFRNNDLIITRPRNAQELQKDVRYLAWGANLESIDLERHFGRAQVPVIILQCMDKHGNLEKPVVEPASHQSQAELVMKGKPAGKTSFVEKSKAPLSPTAKKPKKAKAPMIKETDQYEIETVHGVHDRAVLQQYAKLLRYLRGRGERTVNFSTHHLMDMLGRPLLGLDVGDPIMIDWRDFDHAELSRQTPARRYQDLVERGYQPEVAQAIADSYDALIGTQRPMRVNEMTYSWDCDDGIEISGRALDFITGGEDGKTSPALAASIGKGTP